jgi:biotin carboxylase
MLADKGLPSPGFRLFSIGADPLEAARSVRFPCVLKPVLLSASRGVIRADGPEAFETAFKRIVALLSSPGGAGAGEGADQILVEDYLPGNEVALEGLLTEGELTVLALFDKPDPLEGPYFEETLYVTPSRLPGDLQRGIRDAAAAAADALGLRTGPVHAELRINDAGIWIVEIAARSIGGLCSRILRFGAGISLEELILRQAVGLEPGPMQLAGRAAGVMMLPVPKKGVLRSIWGVEEAKRVPGIEDVALTIPLDQEVEPVPEGSRYLGFIFGHGERPEEVEAALREAYRRLAVMIEPPESPA